MNRRLLGHLTGKKLRLSVTPFSIFRNFAIKNHWFYNLHSSEIMSQVLTWQLFSDLMNKSCHGDILALSRSATFLYRWHLCVTQKAIKMMHHHISDPKSSTRPHLQELVTLLRGKRESLSTCKSRLKLTAALTQEICTTLYSSSSRSPLETELGLFLYLNIDSV